jgi:hypothetical protein
VEVVVPGFQVELDAAPALQGKLNQLLGEDRMHAAVGLPANPNASFS